MVEDKLDSLRLELEEFILQKMHHALKQFSKECKKTFFFFFQNIRWSSCGINFCVYYNTVYHLSRENILKKKKKWNKILVSTKEVLHIAIHSLEIFCPNFS